MAKFAALFTLTIAGFMGFAGCARGQADPGVSTPQPASATKSPSIRVIDLDDQPFDLRQSSSGRVHVVVFTRSDCPISNRMAPEVRELYTKFHPQGVDFYLIYVDPRETPEAIRTHLREYEYPCPALRDPEHTLVARTKATVTPEAVVLDRDWKIKYRGRINDQFEDFGKSREVPTKHDLREAIVATLAGKPLAEPVTKAIGCYIDDLK